MSEKKKAIEKDLKSFIVDVNKKDRKNGKKIQFSFVNTKRS
jgi:hypothetical protein